MRVGDLIETLQEFDQESEVRIASIGHRSHFEYSLDDVVEADVSDEDDEDVELVVYLEEGIQIGYLPGPARDELGV